MAIGVCAPEFQLSQAYCPDICNNEAGRIRGIAFVSGLVDMTDYTSVQHWSNVLYSNLGFIIPGTIGSSDGSTATMQPGYGDVPEYLGGRSYTITYRHPYECRNKLFYDFMTYQQGYHLWYATETMLHTSGKNVSIFATDPITEDLASIREFNVTVKYTSKEMTQCYTDAGDVVRLLFKDCETKDRALLCYPGQEINPGGGGGGCAYL